MNAECHGCGVTAADLPHEEMSLSVSEASDLWFEDIGGRFYCMGCAQLAHATREATP